MLQMHFPGREAKWTINVGIVVQRFSTLLNDHILYSYITLKNIYPEFFKIQFIYVWDSIGIETSEKCICYYLVETPERINRETNKNA